MKIIKASDYQAMCKIAANIFFAQITLKNDSVLGLATGSTPIGVYQELIKMYNNKDLDFSNVKTVNLDEYVSLSGENDQSYRYFMNNNLFNHINIDKNNTNVPNGLADDICKECENYEKIIKDLGGIDMQILGIGNNGHIAFNEPNEFFDKTTHQVTLQESTISANARFFDSIDDVPKTAISMGIASIMKAKKILLLASGAAKSDIVYKSFFGNITPQVPASALQLHPDVTVIVDDEAYLTIAEKIK